MPLKHLRTTNTEGMCRNSSLSPLSLSPPPAYILAPPPIVNPPQSGANFFENGGAPVFSPEGNTEIVTGMSTFRHWNLNEENRRSQSNQFVQQNLQQTYPHPDLKQSSSSMLNGSPQPIQSPIYHHQQPKQLNSYPNPSQIPLRPPHSNYNTAMDSRHSVSQTFSPSAVFTTVASSPVHHLASYPMQYRQSQGNMYPKRPAAPMGYYGPVLVRVHSPGGAPQAIGPALDYKSPPMPSLSPYPVASSPGHHDRSPSFQPNQQFGSPAFAVNENQTHPSRSPPQVHPSSSQQIPALPPHLKQQHAFELRSLTPSPPTQYPRFQATSHIPPPNGKRSPPMRPHQRLPTPDNTPPPSVSSSTRESFDEEYPIPIPGRSRSNSAPQKPGPNVNTRPKAVTSKSEVYQYPVVSSFIQGQKVNYPRPLPLAGPPPPGYEPISPIRVTPRRQVQMNVNDAVREGPRSSSVKTFSSKSNQNAPAPLKTKEIQDYPQENQYPEKSLISEVVSKPTVQIDAALFISPVLPALATPPVLPGLPNTPSLDLDDLLSLESDFDSILDSFSSSGLNQTVESPKDTEQIGQKAKKKDSKLESDLFKEISFSLRGSESDLLASFSTMNDSPGMTRGWSASAALDSETLHLAPKQSFRPLKTDGSTPSVMPLLKTKASASSSPPLAEQKPHVLGKDSPSPPPQPNQKNLPPIQGQIHPDSNTSVKQKMDSPKTLSSPTCHTTPSMSSPPPRTTKNKSPCLSYLVSVGGDASENKRARSPGSITSPRRNHTFSNSPSMTPQIDQAVVKSSPSLWLSQSPLISSSHLSTNTPEKKLFHMDSFQSPRSMSIASSSSSCCTNKRLAKTVTTLDGDEFVADTLYVKDRIRESVFLFGNDIQSESLEFYVMPLEGNTIGEHNDTIFGEVHVSIFAQASGLKASLKFVHGLVVRRIDPDGLGQVASLLHKTLQDLQGAFSHHPRPIRFIKPSSPDPRKYMCSSCQSYKFRGPQIRPSSAMPQRQRLPSRYTRAVHN